MTATETTEAVTEPVEGGEGGQDGSQNRTAGEGRHQSAGFKASDDPDHDADASKEDPAEDSRAGREAAKYRRQLRDVETERDTLRGTLETLQRAEVQRIASADLAQPAALWAAGTQLADLLGEDGTVDPAKVTAAVGAARVALGLAQPIRQPMPDPGQGITDPKAATPDGSWQSMLRGK